MAGNEVTLTFAGDAQQLQQAAARAEQSVQEVAEAAESGGEQMAEAGQQSSRLDSGLARIVGTSGSLADAFSNVSGSISAFSDWSSRGARQADETARALLDVEQASADAEQAIGDLRQAQLDLNQSFIDAKQASADATQAAIDIQQAALDAETAQVAYNEAVKEFGAGSAEAKQAQIDLQQANADLTQANIDAEQAANDFKQAQEDGSQATRDMTQASIDARSAQIDLNEAQREAKPPNTLQQIGRELEAITPLLIAAIGLVDLVTLAVNTNAVAWVRNAAAQTAAKIATIATSIATGVATAAQWLWNIAMTANPIGLIIVAIAALVAAIIWIATQTDWFSKLWEAIWSGIVAYIGWVVDNYKKAFNLIVGAGRWLVEQFFWVRDMIAKVWGTFFSILTAPFRAAFNFIATAWNATIGKLRWTVPSWVPGIGGNSISAPTLPKFHTGGVVPGAPGTEMLALLQAGETVTPAGESAGGPTVLELRSDGSELGDFLVDILARAVVVRGGDVQLVLGGRRG